ncbi:hypothetical protein BGX28_009019 [Mortierella sp. GBA30]|nr:hypothetical protein BGX28_009019 [Mortierella sp. GBA30]
MPACNCGTAYAVDIVLIRKLFYHIEKPFIASYLLILTTQITGYAFAGAIRRFLVRPAHMVWPSTLVYTSLYQSMHAKPDASDLTGSSGLGIGTIALDWATATNALAPLVTPWFSQVNIMVGFVFVVYIIVPWANYTILWDSKTFPIYSQALFSQNGSTRGRNICSYDYFAPEIVQRWKMAQSENDDVHIRLMHVYPEVPTGGTVSCSSSLLVSPS